MRKGKLIGYDPPKILDLGSFASVLGQTEGICSVGLSPSGSGIKCETGGAPAPSSTCDNGFTVGPTTGYCQVGDTATTACQAGGLARGGCNIGTQPT
jgi:hypothetical protein